MAGWEEEEEKEVEMGPGGTCGVSYSLSSCQPFLLLHTSGKNHFHEMNGDVGMAGWK